eukprot:12378794-Alexandrium_andersonii.AAC.1
MPLGAFQERFVSCDAKLWATGRASGAEGPGNRNAPMVAKKRAWCVDAGTARPKPARHQLCSRKAHRDANLLRPRK